MSAAVIFSDLHLPNFKNDDYRLFLKTLAAFESRADITELWLLGDIFDCFVGDQGFWMDVHGEFWAQLERLAKLGKKVLYFEGNHDFAFKSIAIRHGVQAFSEGRCHLFQGRRIFLSHGDEIDVDDEAYARWRKFIKSTSIRRAYRMVPPALTRKFLVPFAEAYSSKRKLKRDPEHFENEVLVYREKFRNYAETVLRERAYHAVFLGHSHMEELEVLGANSFYCNLGSWLGEAKPYAIWDPEKQSVPTIINCT